MTSLSRSTAVHENRVFQEGGWHPNIPLIGEADARRRLQTPALLVELAPLTRNINAMAEIAAKAGVALRPHVKAHKCPAIAHRQISAGAIGVACVTLDEVEAMVFAGIGNVLITSPLVTTEKIDRLIALIARAGTGDIQVVADQPGNIAALAAAARHGGVILPILVDYDVGQNRTGAPTPDAALKVAQSILDQPNLKLAGLQAYAGHIQHIVDRNERQRAAGTVHARVHALLDLAAERGIDFPTISGGGTGTHAFDAQSSVFTELQPGSYVFMDAEYQTVLSNGGVASPFETSLFVQTTVVSAHHLRRATIDGGTKCFATDGGNPETARGAPFDSQYIFAGDEHGKLLLTEGSLPPGARVEFVTPHCDPTVNLHNACHVMDGDHLVAIWPIRARGY